MKAPFLIGRILFGSFFIKSGIDHLLNRKSMASSVESKGIPNGELAVAATAVPLIVGGTSVLLGTKPKWGALAIIGFLAGVSPIMHNFWSDEDPQKKQQNMIDFAKNVALAGGALALMGIDEPWEASVSPTKPGIMERVADKVKEASQKIAA